MNITIILPCCITLFASLYLFSWCESDISLQYFNSNFQCILRKADRAKPIRRCNLQDSVQGFLLSRTRILCGRVNWTATYCLHLRWCYVDLNWVVQLCLIQNGKMCVHWKSVELEQRISILVAKLRPCIQVLCWNVISWNYGWLLLRI